MCYVCGPGKPPQPASFFLLWSWQMHHTFCGRNIALLSIPLEEVRYLPTIYCVNLCGDGLGRNGVKLIELSHYS